jgi:L-fuculose-phosphate aldolase
MDGRCSSTLQPSSEMPMHLAVYEANAHVQVILHTHPTALLALSLVRPEGPLLGTGLFEARALLSRLARIPPLPPGGTELAEAVARAASEHAAVWMERHGLVCVGSRPEDVLALSESLENLAKVELLVCSAVGRSGQTKDG